MRSRLEILLARPERAILAVMESVTLFDFLFSGGVGSIAAILVGAWGKHQLNRDMESYKASLKDQSALQIESHKAALKEQADTQIERYKAELHTQITPEIERAKAEIRRDEGRWAWLDQKAVELLVNLFARLTDLNSALLAASWSPGGFLNEHHKQQMEYLDAATKNYFSVSSQVALYVDDVTWEYFESHRKASTQLIFAFKRAPAEKRFEQQLPKLYDAYDDEAKKLKKRIREEIWRVQRDGSLKAPNPPPSTRHEPQT